jgi:alpha,alpha-trehalase
VSGSFASRWAARSRLVLAGAALAGACRVSGPGAAHAPGVVAWADPLAVARLAPVRAYIASGWRVLTRSNRDLPEAARDPKVPLPAGARWPVYLAADEDLIAVSRRLAEELGPSRLARVELRPLPRKDPAEVRPAGLLYLPEPYVVPGGRFNEMYGWDSYFIVLGLVRDGEIERARQQTDDFLYEVQHYGKVLNANRSYYLTRSQPPLLSGMVRAVFAVTRDRTWLGRARAALEETYRFWTTPPHLAGETGLSRYFDTGSGPAPEVVAGERDAEGRSHYERVQAFFHGHSQVEAYDVARFYDRAGDRLTPLFYRGDRSMRESGFDPSERWGPFGVDVIDYAPVCLNVLLAVLETDLAAIARELGDGPGAVRWDERVRARRGLVDRYLWDEQSGLYLDWSFVQGRRRRYPFATTFWPLWAGLASPGQAARVRAQLPLFEGPGGIRTSDRVTGNQWDAPFGWAPLQLFAALGLARQGFRHDAERVARAFLTMVVEDFERRGTLVEKYDVERRTSQVEAAIRFGYAENQVGFGWTNGVVLELLATLFPGR